MEIHDEHVSEDLFAEFTARMPQVCVEVVLETEEGILLAKRTNEPAKGEWFWPGGRLYKGEELEAAARRVAQEELGIDVAIEERLGVYAHFWETSAVAGEASRHTVNVVFRVTPADSEFEIELDDQHEAYRFLSEIEVERHDYVHSYIEENGLLDS
ncbi:MAG: NUDIX domain-containing protein [Halobacteriales archaeon]